MPCKLPTSLVLVIVAMIWFLTPVTATGAPESGDTISVTSLGQQAAGITVERITRTRLPNQINVPGKIEAITTMEFDQHAPLSGRIQRLATSLGSVVTKGQTLAIVESTEMNQLAAQFLQSRLDTEAQFAAQRTQLEGEVRQAQEKLNLADANYKRVQRLYEEKIAAHKDLIAAQTDFQLAQSELAMARGNRDIMVKTLKARIDLTQNPIRQRLQILGVDEKRIEQMLANQKTITTVPIVAARSGIITNIIASPGMSIDPSTNLFTISDLSKVWATANVYESDIHMMQLGEKVDVRVHALPEQFHGRLTFIGSQVDPTTRTLPVRAELDNSNGRLKPDMYAELLVQTSESRPVIVLPRDAIVHGVSGSAAFVEKSPGKFREVDITLGRQFGQMVEISSGLEDGDRVVVRGAFQLHAQLLKEHGREDLFTSPTEGERLEDHAVDNKTGAVHMNIQTVLLIIGAAFLLGFAISALLMFRGRSQHECSADLADEHDHPEEAPAALPSVVVEGKSTKTNKTVDS